MSTVNCGSYISCPLQPFRLNITVTSFSFQQSYWTNCWNNFQWIILIFWYSKGFEKVTEHYQFPTLWAKIMGCHRGFRFSSHIIWWCICMPLGWTSCGTYLSTCSIRETSNQYYRLIYTITLRRIWSSVRCRVWPRFFCNLIANKPTMVVPVKIPTTVISIMSSNPLHQTQALK